MHQHSGNRAAVLLKASLDDGSPRRHFRIGRKCRNLRDKLYGLQETLQPVARSRGHGNAQNVSAPVLDEHLLLRELPLDALRVGCGNIHLVDSHDNRHVCRLAVIDRLDCLWHDAIVRCHHEHRDIRHIRPARPQRRERLMARRVQKRDGSAFHIHLVRADVLRYAARLPAGHIRFPYGVEDAGLAVIDVSQDGDDRWTWLSVLGLLRVRHPLAKRGVVGFRLVHVESVEPRDWSSHFGVDGVIQARHYAHPHQVFDHLDRVRAHLLREFTHGDGAGQLKNPVLGSCCASLCSHGENRLAFPPACNYCLRLMAETVVILCREGRADQ